MVGKIAIVRLIANCAVTLHLYRSIYEYKIYQPALLHRNTSEVMKAPCRSVNDLCRGQAFLIPPSVNIVTGSESTVPLKSPVIITGSSPAICFIFSSINLALSRRATSPTWSKCVESSYFPATHLVFQHSQVTIVRMPHPNLSFRWNRESRSVRNLRSSKAQNDLSYKKREQYSPFSFPSARPTPRAVY